MYLYIYFLAQPCRFHNSETSNNDATDQSSHAFKEVAIIRHPRIGEYAFGFITNTVLLQRNVGEEELCCVYVPSNHLYIGDVFLISSIDILRPNLSVREGIGTIFTILSYHHRNVLFNYESINLMIMWLLIFACFSRNCHIWGHVNTSTFNHSRCTSHSSIKNQQFCTSTNLMLDY